MTKKMTTTVMMMLVVTRLRSTTTTTTTTTTTRIAKNKSTRNKARTGLAATTTLARHHQRKHEDYCYQSCYYNDNCLAASTPFLQDFKAYGSFPTSPLFSPTVLPNLRARSMPNERGAQSPKPPAAHRRPDPHCDSPVPGCIASRNGSAETWVHPTISPGLGLTAYGRCCHSHHEVADHSCPTSNRDR